MLTARDRAHAYDTLTAGGFGYLLPVTVYALAVLLRSPPASPCRSALAFLVVVVCLGPLTLLRPLVVAVARLGAVLTAAGPPCWSARPRGAAVLCVEPAVHRRWYHHVR
ncbi:hypothetical protein AB0945_13500 [Streptomyces sp. NPDC005474]|uniref:hypothetical protein n=1 Tax=Streptomyces sp. NPDC005474 TaxID=3154878 RepID=UPI003453161E